jgi:hypothetical protein
MLDMKDELAEIQSIDAQHAADIKKQQETNQTGRRNR